MVICNLVGARPNFMKIGPVVHALRRQGIAQYLVHTGQHYDARMSQVFFEELGLPEPDIYLGIGSDSHGRQTARIMIAFEEICQLRRPDLVVVGGDVNSTLAAALVAAKLHIPIAHVEAGLRSFDRTMPEEINRIVTDQLSELLFTTEESANTYLRREHIDEGRIHYVGNCMIDTLLKYADVAISRAPWRSLGLDEREYALCTLHRPSNVDSQDTLRLLIGIVNEVSAHLPVVFPVHPRTRAHMLEWDIPIASSVHVCDPLPYLEFLGLMAKARYVLTDSGGIQEETTVLGVPCLTMRNNTERPVTLICGTNRLVGTDSELIYQSVDAILAGNWPAGQRPPLWDGHAAERIVGVIERWSSTHMPA
jgi:UDP-N-acetylglucosamine 2-epimerase (non-hydrolysing)